MGEENTTPQTTAPAETSPVAKPFYQRWWEGLGELLDGRLGSATDAAAKTLHGEKGEFLGSERLKYWQMNGPGGEEALKRLKLAARPKRTT